MMHLDASAQEPEVQMGEPLITYRIDANDKICFVSPEWTEFARNNGAADLAEPNIVGRSLWDFVTGDAVVWLYKELFREIRSKRTEARFLFRCDSPTALRRISMHIRAIDNDVLECQSILLEQTARDPVPVMFKTPSDDAEAITVCSNCRRIRQSDKWVEIGELARNNELVARDGHIAVEVGLCPDCEQTILENTFPLAIRIYYVVTHFSRLLRLNSLQGASPQRNKLLSTLETLGPATIKELSAAELITQSTVSRLVSALERDGLVERASDASDKRSVRLQLTAHGRESLKGQLRHSVAPLGRLISDMSEHERAIVDESVQILEARLSQQRVL